MRFLLGLLLTLLLIGCSGTVQIGDILRGAAGTSPPVITLHMDTEFTAEERADANNAALLWNKQTGGVAKITLLYDLDFNSPSELERLQDSNLVIRAESDMRVVVAMDNGCVGCVLGWMTSGGLHNVGHGPINGAFVVDRIPRESRTQVMLHEFGHALGLPHVPARQAIMYPSLQAGQSTCLKKPDLVAFCEVNECGSAQMVSFLCHFE